MPIWQSGARCFPPCHHARLPIIGKRFSGPTPLPISRRSNPKARVIWSPNMRCPVSAMALKAITGLTQMTNIEMDSVSQAMIDGCANYAGIPEVASALPRGHGPDRRPYRAYGTGPCPALGSGRDASRRAFDGEHQCQYQTGDLGGAERAHAMRLQARFGPC